MALKLKQAECLPCDFEVVESLSTQLGVSELMAQILVRRGCSSVEEADELLSTDCSYSAKNFRGIETAAKTVLEAIAAGKRVTVYGDYDVDGVSATALLVRALKRLEANVNWFIPSRIEDGYGLSRDALDRLIQRGSELIVTVDCGVTAVEEVAYLKQSGVDVIITDHHSVRADGLLPDCPIVHPQVCEYPFLELCGTAVAYKFAQSLAPDDAGYLSALDEDLDLVAIATVADVMPVRSENRNLIKRGLEALRTTTKPGLKALLERASVSLEAIDTDTVSFRLAPRMNAAGRMGYADAALELLMTEAPERAAEIANELERANEARREVEREVYAAAKKQITELGERPAYVVAGEGWHQGVVGIVAARIAERHNVPAVVIALDSEGQGSGSARSVAGFDLLAAVTEASFLLQSYGGHAAAAGLKLKAEDITQFREEFERVVSNLRSGAGQVPIETIDAIATPEQLTIEVAEELERLAPFGNANPCPQIMLPGVELAGWQQVGEGQKHARFKAISSKTSAEGIAFGVGPVETLLTTGPVDLSVHLQINRWRNSVTPQLMFRSLLTVETDQLLSGEFGRSSYVNELLAAFNLQTPELLDQLITFGDVSASSNSGLRDNLAVLYRCINALGGSIYGKDLGIELSKVGSAQLVAYMLKIFVELEICRLEPLLPAVRLLASERTELAKSATFRHYQDRCTQSTTTAAPQTKLVA